jgi:hypothetical protein
VSDSIAKKLIEVDKKLDVLINTVNHENNASREFRLKTEKDMDSVFQRVRTIEIEQASNRTNQDDFKTVKNSIIKIVITAMFSIVTVAGALAFFIAKQG